MFCEESYKLNIIMHSGYVLIEHRYITGDVHKGIMCNQFCNNACMWVCTLCFLCMYAKARKLV